MSNPVSRLKERIQVEGPIPFAALMEEALYGEGGYYLQEGGPIGVEGDFVTGASLSPLFGRTTAELIRRLDASLATKVDFLEVGHGNGAHLRGLLAALEPSPERRVLACDRARRSVPPGVVPVRSLEDLPPRHLQGVIFSYELFDALPVHRLVGEAEGGLSELWVELDARGEFRYRKGDLSDPALAECLGGGEVVLEPGQIADLAPDWGPLYGCLARLLERGLLVTCDYGYERERLLDTRVRPHGTLACYRRQRVHRDALRWVGQQDLTAHVDFTTLIEAGDAAGLETLAFTRQARWLSACGLFDLLQQADQESRLQAMDLLAGDGMGEEIRVLVQGRGVDLATLVDREVLGGER